MVRYQDLSKNRRKFLAMTGYTDEEFQALLPHFQGEFEKYVAEYRLDGQKRTRRKYSTYKSSPLPTMADKLLFMLIYLKQGGLQEAQATLFGMHQPDANKWIHRLHPLLNRALARLGELPARTAEALDQVLEPSEPVAAEVKLVVFLQDGTERAIVRPTDQEAQKLYYSGKKNNIPSKTLSSSMPAARLFS